MQIVKSEIIKNMKIISEDYIDPKYKSTLIVYRNSNPSDYEMQNQRNCQNGVLLEDITEKFEIKISYNQLSNVINILKKFKRKLGVN
jgi:hypothetical protein